MKGSCLCGAVAYEATLPADGLHIGFCSCPSCRKAHDALEWHTPFQASCNAADGLLLRF